jgi:hypothetical protein
MLLVCGNQQDILVQEFISQGNDSSTETIILTETEMFNETGLCLTKSRLQTDGYLRVGTRRFELAEIKGVLLRLNRDWWPSASFDLKDQMFVYHETVAAWYALLDSLSCPVLNRWGLGWWLQDLCYPERLRVSLGELLQLPLVDNDNASFLNGRLLPTSPRQQEGLESVYRAAGQTIAGDYCSEALIDYMDSRKQQVLEWEAQHGIYLSRLDFHVGDGITLEHAESYPALNQEVKGITSRIAVALREVMTKAAGVVV